MLSIKNDVAFLIDCGFLKNDFTCLCLKFKNILLEQNGKYIEYNRNEEDSVIKKILIRLLEAFFSTVFEDVRHERSLIFLLSLTDLE